MCDFIIKLKNVHILRIYYPTRSFSWKEVLRISTCVVLFLEALFYNRKKIETYELNLSQEKSLTYSAFIH